MKKYCQICNAELKPLFNVTLFCPNDCDRIVKPDAKWYSYYQTTYSVGSVIESEPYLTTDLKLAKEKAQTANAKLWQVQLASNAKIRPVINTVYSGGPVVLVREINDG